MNAICKRAAAIVVMAIIALGLTTCKKAKIDVPTVKVFEGAITINYTKASVSAEVTDQGGAEVQSRGFVYGLSGGSFDTIFCGSGVGVYSADFNNLQPNTTYVYEAFAKNAGGTGTSGKVTFTTRDHELPIVKTAEVDNVGTTTASCGGNVTGDGGANITERGVCWSTNHNPSVSESHVSAGSGLGEYTCNMTNLSANTTYYVRAYAKNSKGVGYGEEKQLTTLDFDLPEVITANVNDITQSTAKGGGEVTSDGGTTVTERGLCWSTSHNPSISGSHANNGSGTGNFTCNITGLNAHTKYYVRAYATNSKGTAYGEEVNFTTSANKPTVSTGSVTNITTTTATGSGNVINDGGSSVTERGLCWSTHHEPTINGTHIMAGEGTGEFTAAMNNLAANTTYYVRAYATNGAGTSYGDEVEFATLSVSVPSVITASVTNIGQTTATGGGNVISSGGEIVTERGICWSTSHNPTISGSHQGNGTGTGNYTVNMTGLNPNTTYYVRAYAINSQGIAYGEEVNFKTGAISQPSVTTNNVTNITQTTATCGGNVTSDGGATVTVRGVCWSTSPNPTVNGSHTTNGSGTGNFTSNITGLTQNTTYYVKAYAINSQGPAYGEEVSFKTSQTPTYTISVSANPTNGGTVTGGGTYQQGQSCTVSATKATGYNFLKWTENGTQVSTNTNYTFNVTGNRTLVAQFQAQSYIISASASPSNGGTVSGSGTYTYGQSCTLTANHATGYTFVKWTKNGTQVSTNTSYTFTVTESASYIAHFQANSYTISVSADPSNGGTVSGGGTYTYGQSCTVHAYANSGYTFTNWTVNGSQVSTNANYTFTVTSNRSLVAHFDDTPTWPNGMLPGYFSVSATQQVRFSQGNLQYKASTNTWRFADNQYDIIGSANSNISSSYSGWIDLFGWGTSGWNCGNIHYHPWDSDYSDYTSGGLYGPLGAHSLTGSYANSDWGHYNSISNGGNTSYTWRTLTRQEWDYIFNTRSTPSGIRYAKAKVNNVNGVILVPDNWSTNTYVLSCANQSEASFNSNVISASQWNILQNAGIVFLPAGGFRYGTSVSYVGEYGDYWSATNYGNYDAYVLFFDDSELGTSHLCPPRYAGESVRLVCPVY